MLKIGVLISGSGSNLQSVMDACATGMIHGEVVLVLSNRASAYGLERAKKAGIPALSLSPKDYSDAEAYDEEVLRRLQEARVDLVVLAGYLRVLSPALVSAFEHRMMNIHPSLIPSFCGDGFYGLKVHEAAIRRGVKVSGATVHFVDQGTDTGPIILQETVAVSEGDTPEILQEKVLEIEHRLLPKAVALFSEGKLHVSDGHVTIE